MKPTISRTWNTNAVTFGLFALGALALGAIAIGSVALFRLSVRKVDVAEARFGKPSVDGLEVRERMEPARVEPEPPAPSGPVAPTPHDVLPREPAGTPRL